MAPLYGETYLTINVHPLLHLAQTLNGTPMAIDWPAAADLPDEENGNEASVTPGLSEPDPTHNLTTVTCSSAGKGSKKMPKRHWAWAWNQSLTWQALQEMAPRYNFQFSSHMENWTMNKSIKALTAVLNRCPSVFHLKTQPDFTYHIPPGTGQFGEIKFREHSPTSQSGPCFHAPLHNKRVSEMRAPLVVRHEPAGVQNKATK